MDKERHAMNDVAKAERAVQKVQTRLTELEYERDRIGALIDSLHAERAEALTLLARGENIQNRQERAVRRIDQKIDSTQVTLEGVSGLIADAQAALETAKGELQEAKNEQQRQFDASFSQKEQETQRRLMWGKIKNLLKKSAGHSDVCRDSPDGLYVEEQFPVLSHLEKEAAGRTVMTDLQRLIQKYREEITQLEAQIKELAHKHDIVVEASRLLEEEVLVPHRNLYERRSDAVRGKVRIQVNPNSQTGR
jgi:hypothetical protein